MTKSEMERPVQNLERAEAREFGRLLQDNGIEAIVNRVTVHNNLKLRLIGSKRHSMIMILKIYLSWRRIQQIKYDGPSVNSLQNILQEI